MTYFSRFRTHMSALMSSFVGFMLLTASPLAFAEDEPVSLPDIAPEQIAQDSDTRYNEKTGEREIAAPTFDPFEAIDDLAGKASLRTVHEDGKLSREGDPMHGGAILDLSFFYTSASNDPLETRGFEKAEYLSGETVASLRFDSEIRECSENVREVVYDDGYYRGAPYGYLGGVYTHYPHYRGHSHFGYGLIFGAYDYGYRRGYGHRYYSHPRRGLRIHGGRGYGRRGFGHGRLRDHDRHHGEGRRGGGRRDGHVRDGHIRDGHADEGRGGRGPRFDRDRTPPVFVDRQPGRGQGRRGVSSGRDRVRLLGDRPRFENAPDAPASGRTPRRDRGVGRVDARDVRVTPTSRGVNTRAPGPRNREIPAMRNVQPRAATPRAQSRPPQTRSPQVRPPQTRAPRSAAPSRQSNRSVGRATDRTFRSQNRSFRNSGGRRQFDVFPVLAGTYGRRTVSVSYQCAREETLSLHIPQDRLDAGRFDGFTVYIIDKDRNELPVYIPANYVEGFRLATREKANRIGFGSHDVGTGSSVVKSSREPIIYGDLKPTHSEDLAGGNPDD